MSSDTACTELEYYEDIILHYEESFTSDNQSEIEEWMDTKYISILDDLKSKKPISDASIEDVAKNAILLILNLFKSKRDFCDSVTWQCLSREERKLVRDSLLKVLTN